MNGFFTFAIILQKYVKIIERSYIIGDGERQLEGVYKPWNLQ